MTLEHAEALQAVYPSIYGELQEQILEIVGSRESSGEPVSFAARTVLGLFGGLVTDDTLKPENLARIQESMGPDDQAQPPGPASPPPVAPPPVSAWQRMEAGA